MSDAERINEVLKHLGSDRRVQSGETISEGITAIAEALPAFVERLVREAINQAKEKS